MGDVLTADRIRTLRECCSSGATVTARQIALMADSHEELRTRLENVEAALGKTLSVIDRDSKSLGNILSGAAGRHAQWEMQERVYDAVRCAHAALGAAGERSEG